MADLKAKE